MPKLHTHNLSLGATAAKLYVSMGVALKEEQIVAQFQDGGLLNDISLNSLYRVVKSKRNQAEEQATILININFQQTLAAWLYRDEITANDLSAAFTPRSQLQMIELMDIIISSAAESPELMSNILLVSQKILTCFYKVVERSQNMNLKHKYLDCISKMFKINPDIFNIGIYAEMLSLTEDKIDQFYEFLDFYLLQRTCHQPETIKFILEGFAKRMRMFSQRSLLTLLTKIEKRGIMKAYLKLIEFIKKKMTSNLPEKILNEHADIFEYLNTFAHKDFNHHELSKVFNNLVYVYINSRVNNVYKFPFILSVYKYVLSRSPSLFSFMCTDFLASQEFLRWFVATQLSFEFDKGKEVLEIYLKNSQSLQFLLVLVIYYLHHCPEKIPEISSYMKFIGLLEESKCFLHQNAIQLYFKAFYRLVQDEEYFEDFLNSIQDQAQRIFG